MSEPQTTQSALPPHLSPKEQFLSIEDVSNKWRSMARAELFLTVLTYSFSEYALTQEPTAEQIRGVRNFIETLLNLAEPKSPPRAPFPDRRLTPIAPEKDNATKEKK